MTPTPLSTLPAHLFGGTVPSLDIELTSPVFQSDVISYPAQTVQTVSVPSDASTGTFQLALPSAPPASGPATKPIAYNAAAVFVQAALQSVPSVGAVSVSETPGNPATHVPNVFEITFAIRADGTPVPQLQVQNSDVNGTGSVSTAVTEPGGTITAGVKQVTVVLDDGAGSGGTPTESVRNVELGSRAASPPQPPAAADGSPQFTCYPATLMFPAISAPAATAATPATPDRTASPAGAAPVVSAVHPATGNPAGGTTITITGFGFTGAIGVGFGGNSAEAITVASDAQITATSPAGTGTVDVTVTTPAGTSAPGPPDRFTYTAPQTIPVALSSQVFCNNTPDGVITCPDPLNPGGTLKGYPTAMLLILDDGNAATGPTETQRVISLDLTKDSG